MLPHIAKTGPSESAYAGNQTFCCRYIVHTNIPIWTTWPRIPAIIDWLFPGISVSNRLYVDR